MHTVILKGQEALHYAEAHHIPTVHAFTDESGEDSKDVDLTAARDMLKEHPERVWLEIKASINPGD